MKAKATFIGRLTKDPESREVNGTNLTTFSIACNYKFKDEKKVDFYDLEAWRKAGEYIQQFAKKGDQVHVEAELRNDKFQDKNGNDRTKVKFTVVPMTFEFLGGGQATDGISTAGADQAPAKSKVKTPTSSDTVEDPDLDEDVPF